MLYVILGVTTKKISIDYTQNNVIRESSHVTTKNKLNTKEGNNEVNKGKKTVRHFKTNNKMAKVIPYQ